MKNFLLNILACLAAFFIIGIFGMMMFFSMFIFTMVSGDNQPSIPNDGILHINLSGSLQEKGDVEWMDILMGNTDSGDHDLSKLKMSIREAAQNKNIKGIYLDCGVMSTDFALLEELRGELKQFKKSRKFIIAYGESISQGAYYVASVADKLYLNPQGMLMWKGLAATPMFYKHLMEKLGVEMQIFRVGTFKSAVEPYMLDKMSPANREMTASMLNSLWGVMCKDVAASRQISEDSLRTFANRYQELAAPKTYVREKLVDKLLYIDEVRDVLRKYLGGIAVNFVTPADLAEIYKPAKSKNKIAVYVAHGEIIDGRLSNNRWSSNVISGNDMVDDLDALANDDEVKAVVLRVNSPGGSAYASEQIWRAVQLLKRKKPVVVSMSGLAASGGYYLSCGANYIFADPMTLTGSIGIFAMIPNTAKLQEQKLGLSYDYVSTNNTPPMAAPTGQMSLEGAAAMQAYVNRGYHLFLSRVAEGRKMKVEQVDSIAQGRVWTGKQAVRIGLVDQLGNLDDALKKAAQLAKLDDYAARYDSDERSPFEQWFEKTKDGYFERELRARLGLYYEPVMFLQTVMNKAPLQARMTFDPNIQ